MGKSLKILYLVTEDWYFCSHRLELGAAAVDAGYDVEVVTNESASGEAIRRCGMKLSPLNFYRGNLNPFRDLWLFLKILRIYQRKKPDIVHHIALKPLFWGTIAALIARVPAIVNSFNGVGFLFISDSWKARLLRPVVMFVFRMLFSLRNTRYIVQNADDLMLLRETTISKTDNVRLIRGAGVNTESYRPRPCRSGAPVVMLPSRMLWSKGVNEFVNAARILHDKGVVARFVLVGDPDMANPQYIPEETLRQWHQSGVVEWWGFQGAMTEMFNQASIVCLPSYREGLPRALIEAAACGVPIVASDVPGCREVVRHGVNGYLVPVKNASALAAAIADLLADPELCQRMGQAGREMAVSDFALDMIIAQTFAVYREFN